MFTPLLLKARSGFSLSQPEARLPRAPGILRTPLFVRRDRHIPYCYSCFRRLATLFGAFFDNMWNRFNKMHYMSLPTCPRKPSCFDRDIGKPYAPSCVGGGLHEPVAIEKEAVAVPASTSKEASCLYSPSCLEEVVFSETWRGRGLFRLIRDTCKLDATMAQAASSLIPNRSATSLSVRGSSMLSNSPASRQWGEWRLGVLCSRRGGLCLNVLSM
jgi:hypothetical protein